MKRTPFVSHRTITEPSPAGNGRRNEAGLMGAETRYAFYEFFAGGGMARAGLGTGWRCDFANDFDPAKAEAYAANHGADHLHVGDVAAISAADLPGQADLAWASFPCQDLSLAGPRSGLGGARSGTFFAFWRLIEQLNAEGRAPRLIGLENVPGLLTCSGGADFAALCEALDQGGYRFGALEIDARWFLPQSRPRLFVTALRKDLDVPEDLVLDAAPESLSPFHTRAVRKAHAALPDRLKENWLWWALPVPPVPNERLEHLLDPPEKAVWHTAEQTRRLTGLMSPATKKRLAVVKREGTPAVGALYRRMRVEKGRKVQRAEARFDGLAGCLRTPGGGSSRQFVIAVNGRRVRTRPMTGREYARLMGLSDDFALPGSERAALHLAGDGVAVPVVAFLKSHLFEPVLDHQHGAALAAE
ncbi:MAG: DNA cytosine methyltransferase [Oceanicaulis sp.]